MIMKPVVSEPTDTTPPTTNGEVKEPEEPSEPTKPTKPVEPAEPTEEPTLPADTTPPTVVEVAWYSDWQLMQAIVDDVQPGDTIYAVVEFSEAMLHTVADDKSARPALSIVVDDVATPLRMLKHHTALESGEVKPNKSGTDDFVCKYTIPADASGTIALRVGGATADLAGNTVATVLEHLAPFVVSEPAVEPTAQTTYGIPTPTEADRITVNIVANVFGYDVTSEKELGWLQKRYNIVVSQYSLALFDVETAEGREIVQRMVEYDYNKGQLASNPPDSFEERIELLYQYYAEAFGISGDFAYELLKVYIEENPDQEYLFGGWSRSSVGIAWLLVQQAHPDATDEELLEHFRQAARDGTITITS